jgi:membrane-associated phospholipid phosphatase
MRPADAHRWVAVDIVASASVALAAARRARTRRVGEIEERVFRRVNRLPRSVDGPIRMVMQCGSFGAIPVVAMAVGRRAGARAGWLVLATGISVWGGVKLIKPAVGRGRPQHHLPDVEIKGHPQRGLGFPSGHAAVATAMAMSVAIGRPQYRCAAMTVAFVTGWSRVYVGAHLPLDVVAGHAIGVLAVRCVELVVPG